MTMRNLFLAMMTLLGTLSGCTELEPFLPKVAFDTLDVRDISFENVDVDFVFEVDNPNPIEIGLASFSYDLDLEGVDLLEGDNPDGFTLGNRRKTELRLPVDLLFADIFNTVDATRGEDHVDFDIAGDFGFDTPLGKVDIPYDEGGDFPAIRTPVFNFDALRVTNLGLSSADLALDLGVDNDNGSTLFFDAFDYSISLNNESVVDGLVQTFEVAGAEESTLTLPITVNFLTAGVTIVDAIITGSPLDVGLGASVDVDTPFGIIPLSIDETGNLDIL